MFITAERLALMVRGVAPGVLAALAGVLETAMPQFGVATVLDRAHFMAQACHETGGFDHFEENLRYTSPDRLDAMFSAIHGEADAALLIRQGPAAIANRVYGGRNGNGDEATGDGWRFRGRGCFQLTGKSNYAAASAALGHDYVAQPDLVAQPVGAALTALWFWKAHGCSKFANRDDVAGVTRIINGLALAGLDDRKKLTETAKRIFV